MVPRELYAHLDRQPKHNVEFWVRDFLERPEGKLLQDEDLTNLVCGKGGLENDGFIHFRRTHHGSAEGTLDEHRRHLLQHVIPFFLEQDPPMRQLNQWPNASIKMYTVLQSKGLTTNQIFRATIALRLFFKWAQEETHASGNAVLLTRSPDMSRGDEDTPLDMFMTPAEAYKLANQWATKDADFALFVILGYFFSLRPQEIFGVRVGHFRSGIEARNLESGKTMRGLGLYDRLAVLVTKQRTKQLEERLPKKTVKVGFPQSTETLQYSSSNWSMVKIEMCSY